MSNPLSVRRVKIQDIDSGGYPIGEPSFGIIASDDSVLAFNDSFESLDKLNDAIEDAKSILGVVDPDGTLFPEANHEKIGIDNYYGKDWMTD